MVSYHAYSSDFKAFLDSLNTTKKHPLTFLNENVRCTLAYPLTQLQSFVITFVIQLF